MGLTVLSVAYPLAPVGEDAAGGAEQVIARLDEGLVGAGHRSIVVACAGSIARGQLVTVDLPPGPLDEVAQSRAAERTRSAINSAFARWPVDLVHLHGVDFHRYLPPAGPPVLATLHLPLSFYPENALRPNRPRTFFNCVSAAQQRTCPDGPPLLPAIDNGVSLPALATRVRRRSFALTLGRICPEKGFHLAIAAARRAGVMLLLAGPVFDYPAHRRYFADEIAPHFGAGIRYLGAIGLSRKRRLLAAAQCLVVPSLVAETSSLVAMEALACGTPVVAFAAGALPEIIEDGRTGFIVGDEREMAAALRAAALLDPEACRESARRRFSAERMVARYLALYAALAAGETPPHPTG